MLLPNDWPLGAGTTFVLPPARICAACYSFGRRCLCAGSSSKASLTTTVEFVGRLHRMKKSDSTCIPGISETTGTIIVRAGITLTVHTRLRDGCATLVPFVALPGKLDHTGKRLG